MMALHCHNRTRSFWPDECWMPARKCCRRGEKLVLCVCSATGGHMKSFLLLDPKNKTKLLKQYEIPFVLCLKLKKKKKSFFF